MGGKVHLQRAGNATQRERLHAQHLMLQGGVGLPLPQGQPHHAHPLELQLGVQLRPVQAAREHAGNRAGPFQGKLQPGPPGKPRKRQRTPGVVKPQTRRCLLEIQLARKANGAAAQSQLAMGKAQRPLAEVDFPLQGIGFYGPETNRGKGHRPCYRQIRKRTGNGEVKDCSTRQAFRQERLPHPPCQQARNGFQRHAGACHRPLGNPAAQRQGSLPGNGAAAQGQVPGLEVQGAVAPQGHHQLPFRWYPITRRGKPYHGHTPPLPNLRAFPRQLGADAGPGRKPTSPNAQKAQEIVNPHPVTAESHLVAKGRTEIRKLVGALHLPTGKATGIQRGFHAIRGNVNSARQLVDLKAHHPHPLARHLGIHRKSATAHRDGAVGLDLPGKPDADAKKLVHLGQVTHHQPRQPNGHRRRPGNLAAHVRIHPGSLQNQAPQLDLFRKNPAPGFKASRKRLPTGAFQLEGSGP
ncbi:hypothetical protein HRbin09_01622 [bacterium HR09]|nr:hypothetical protein HRbin09_01622 [bacterium HR09]